MTVLGRCRPVGGEGGGELVVLWGGSKVNKRGRKLWRKGVVVTDLERCLFRRRIQDGRIGEKGGYDMDLPRRNQDANRNS